MAVQVKVSDYIVEYLISKGITDVFGYPGGMVTHLMDSLGKHGGQIAAHVLYHEQGVSFAACGYAQATGKTGVAYATSGPGATNMITAICHAYFDSIPTLFITGQVNTFEANEGHKLRQRGFQETDIVSMVRGVTKYTAYVDSPEAILKALDEAFYSANEGRKGPVLLDIPMNVQRAMVDPEQLEGSACGERAVPAPDIRATVQAALATATRPCLLVGNGVFTAGQEMHVRELIAKWRVPVVSSMLAFHILPEDSPLSRFRFGFIGAYGDRCANFAIAKCDLLIALGARLDVRQVGARRGQFAPGARILRIDVDQNELGYPVHGDDINLCAPLEQAVPQMLSIDLPDGAFAPWADVCQTICEKLPPEQERLPGDLLRAISQRAPSRCIVTADVGQNQVWVAQSFMVRGGQRFLIPGGHSAMGCSLPTAIGACIGGGLPVLCFTGDGGLQMNIQELQTVARENLPVKIIVMNNRSLGMIRHFQQMYFQGRYMQTKAESGYTVPDFCAVAEAYGIHAQKVHSLADIGSLALDDGNPALIEVLLPDETYVYPKLEFGMPNQDQEPLIDRELYQALMGL